MGFHIFDLSQYRYRYVRYRTEIMSKLLEDYFERLSPKYFNCCLIIFDVHIQGKIFNYGLKITNRTTT
jgi:hypothetical protein